MDDKHLKLQISRLVDGDLPPEERDALLRVLDGNAEYSDYYQQMRLMKAGLSGGGDVPVPETFSRSWKNAIAAEGASKKKSSKFPFKILIPVAAAAVCGVFVLSALNTGMFGNAPNSPTEAQYFAEADAVYEAAPAEAYSEEPYLAEEAALEEERDSGTVQDAVAEAAPETSSSAESAPLQEAPETTEASAPPAMGGIAGKDTPASEAPAEDMPAAESAVIAGGIEDAGGEDAVALLELLLAHVREVIKNGLMQVGH